MTEATQVAKIEPVKMTPEELAQGREQKPQAAKRKDVIGNYKWQRWMIFSATTWEELESIVKVTDIAVIDSGHRRLLETALEVKRFVNELRVGEMNEQFLESVVKLLTNLEGHMKRMFAHEERLIQEFSLGNLERHRSSHMQLLERLNEIKRDFQRGSLGSMDNVQLGIIRAMILHFNRVDLPTYKISNLDQYVRGKFSADSLLPLIRTSGVPLIDDSVTEITQELAQVVHQVNPNLYASNTPQHYQQTGNKLKKILGLFQSYTKNEENFMKENNNVGSFKRQQADHQRLYNVLDKTQRILCGVTTESNVNGQGLFRKINEIFRYWLFHISTQDHATHRLSNWASIHFEVAESFEDVEFLVKKTGYESIDQCHEQFVDTVLRIDVSQGSEVELSIVLSSLDQLIELAVNLYAEETMLMDERGISSLEIENHGAEHNRIISMLRNLKTRAKQGGLKFSLQIKIRILTVWIEHCNHWDHRHLHLLGEAFEEEAVG